MQSMTRLHALLKPLAKSDVDRLAREHGAQRYGKGALTVWNQLLVMLHGQFVQAPSLRGALQTHELRRSTLSDGNRRAGMVVLEALPVPEAARGRILDDERIALEIGDLYRSRWQIELLFK